MIEFNIKIVKECTSTNSYLLELGKNGYPEGYSVLAHKQTAGKGTKNKEWISLNGNLFLSTLIKPKVRVSCWHQISLIVGYSLYEYLISLGIDKNIVKIKWPNDVLIKNKKVSGALVEAFKNLCVIGIGLNIKSSPKNDEVAKLATCLNNFVNINALKLVEISRCILKIFYKNYQLWLNYSLKPFCNKISNILAYLNQTIEFIYEKKKYIGIVSGISSLGLLRVSISKKQYLYLSSSETIIYKGS